MISRLHTFIIYSMENAFEQTGAIVAAIRRALPTGEREQKAAQLPALNLAFIGDTVFDLYVRTLLVTQADAKVHELHLMSAKRVCAKGQTEGFRKIEPLLDDEEMGVYKRGRNSHLGTVAKNATISDYRTATGLEALIGYLYLNGRDERLTELMKLILE